MSLVEVIYKKYKMPEEQFKRNVAYKLKIGDILKGNPILENERFLNLDLNEKKIIRVNVIGSIVDKYEAQGEKKYLNLTLDDGSGQIKLKVFGDDVEKFLWVSQGQTVIIIGLLRFYNDEVYIAPEIIKEQDPKYLLVRKLELEKNAPIEVTPNPNNQSSQSNPNQQPTSTRDNVIELIKNSEGEGGISSEKLNNSINSPEVNQEVQKLLEEGIIFEPRPGMLRWLG